MKFLLVYNPRAASGHAEKLLPEISRYCEEHELTVETRLTEFPHHAADIVRSANFDNYDAVIAAGGDGTLFDVVNGMFYRKDKHLLPVGVLPVGTGNAFVRDFPIAEGEWEKAIDIIAEGNRRPVDVGKFFANGKNTYFLNILGLGFVADVTETAHCIKWLGNVAYTIGVLYQTIFLKSHKILIDLDGIQLERDNIFVEVSNTRYTSNFLMAPRARFDDGKLDITLLGKMNRRRLMKSLPTVFTGEHVHLDEVETYQASQIHIIADPPKVLAPDGELWDKTPVHITCLHKALEIFAPLPE